MPPETAMRRGWMSVLAKSRPDRLAELLPDLPELRVLRAPEIGAVMVRGRISASGAPFNLGEMTVTRCSVQLPGGPVGHGYVQGRDKAHATRAAVIDALMQTDRAGDLQENILSVLEQEAQAIRDDRAAKAAATKVEFFTLVRGEDA